METQSCHCGKPASDIKVFVVIGINFCVGKKHLLPNTAEISLEFLFSLASIFKLSKSDLTITLKTEKRSKRVNKSHFPP